jgi:hypothetical protein
MKKIIILFLLCISTIFFKPLTKVNAYVSNVYDITNEWELINAYSTFYVIQWVYADSSVLQECGSFEFRWLITDYNIDTIGGIDSEIIIDYSGGTLNIPLANLMGHLVSDGVNRVYHINIDVRNFIYTGMTAPLYLSEITEISFVQALTENPPAGFYNTWIENSLLYLNSELLTIEFYNLNDIYATRNISFQSQSFAVVNNPVLNDYVFVGWKTITDEFINLTDLRIKTEYINTDTGTMRLYAQYVPVGSVVAEPTITDRVPVFLETLVVDLNLNTSFGYFGIYFFTLLLLVLLILILPISSQVKNTFAYVVYSIYSIFWIYMGALPIYAVVMIIALIMIGGLNLNKMNSLNSGGENG